MQVVRWCRERGIGLVMIGPEAPLVDGLADSLRAAGVPVCGPSAAAAQLEGSKQFLKAPCSFVPRPCLYTYHCHSLRSHSKWSVPC